MNDAYPERVDFQLSRLKRCFVYHRIHVIFFAKENMHNDCEREREREKTNSFVTSRRFVLVFVRLLLTAVRVYAVCGRVYPRTLCILLVSLFLLLCPLRVRIVVVFDSSVLPNNINAENNSNQTLANSVQRRSLRRVRWMAGRQAGLVA